MRSLRVCIGVATGIYSGFWVRDGPSAFDLLGRVHMAGFSAEGGAWEFGLPVTIVQSDIE